MAINKRIDKILKDRFHTLMEDEAFEHVGFKRTNVHGTIMLTYNMMEYVKEWAKYGKLVDTKFREQTGEDIFTRKYNKKLLGELQEIVDNVTPEELLNAEGRFKSRWLDGGVYG